MKIGEKNGENILLLGPFCRFFMLQGLFMILIASPIIIVDIMNGPRLQIFDYLGILIWIIGFIFESIGDWQLTQFIKKKKNKGKIMQSGLWRYSRRPNYFGEVTQWWGIFLLALSVPFGFLSIIGSLTISFLILKVSGIPMLEKNYEGNIKLEKYKRQTSVFFPWFTKNN